MFLSTTNFVKNMSYFSKNWKIRQSFFPRKFSHFKFDHLPVLKKAKKKKERKKEKKKSKERKKEKKCI